MAIPHVSVIFRFTGLDPDGNMKVWIDGRLLPAEAVGFCPICAGQDYAVLVQKAPWSATEGRHTVAIEVDDGHGDSQRAQSTYYVDTVGSDVVGLSGGLLLPSGFGHLRPYVGAGFAVQASGPGGATSGAGTGGLVSIEASVWTPTSGLVPFASQDSVAGPNAWKATGTLPNLAAGLSFGQVMGSDFAALSLRTSPAYATMTVGSGAVPLPGSWAGLDLSLAPFTSKIRHPKSMDSFFAVTELLHFEAEAEEGRRLSIGGSIRHPHGWAATALFDPEGRLRFEGTFTATFR